MIDFFSRDYFEARSRFRSGVLASGGQIESIQLNIRGPGDSEPEREALTIDIGWFGSPEPRRAFIHSSGLHGVEGFAGSAIQLQWLEPGAPAVPPDGAVVVVHVLNPFGMAWLRRANENNVDLNCNFLGSDDKYEGASAQYRALNPFLNPPSSPARDLFWLRALGRTLRHGPSSLRRAVVEGQYEFPQGLAFGGARHEQGARRFQLYIAGKLANAEHVVGVDVHTGPGRFGEGRLTHQEPAEMGKGSLGALYLRMFPGAQVSFAIQEFGSCNHWAALAALRSENRAHHYGGTGTDLREAFCPPNTTWRERILKQGADAIAQGLAHAFD